MITWQSVGPMALQGNSHVAVWDEAGSRWLGGASGVSSPVRCTSLGPATNAVQSRRLATQRSKETWAKAQWKALSKQRQLGCKISLFWNFIVQIVGNWNRVTRQQQKLQGKKYWLLASLIFSENYRDKSVPEDFCLVLDFKVIFMSSSEESELSGETSTKPHQTGEETFVDEEEKLENVSLSAGWVIPCQSWSFCLSSVLITSISAL